MDRFHFKNDEEKKKNDRFEKVHRFVNESRSFLIFDDRQRSLMTNPSLTP